MLKPSPHRGFGILELVVVVAIIGLLAVAALPGFQRMVANAKVRGVTDSLQNGLRLAQAEATRRQRVTVFYRSTSPSCSLTTKSSSSGNHWLVRSLPGPSGGSAEILQCGSSAETTGSPVDVSGPAAICFGVEGRQEAVPKTETGMVDDACTVAAEQALNVSSGVSDRPLRVRVTSAGSVRLCDPNKTYTSSSPDGCP